MDRSVLSGVSLGQRSNARHPFLFDALVADVLAAPELVLLLRGGRGTGKTTVLKELARRAGGVVSLYNLRRLPELERLRGVTTLEPGQWVLIDNADVSVPEVTRVLELSLSVRGVRVVMTALASAAEVGPGLAELLTDEVTLYPHGAGWEGGFVDAAVRVGLADVVLGPAVLAAWRRVLVAETAGHPALLGPAIAGLVDAATLSERDVVAGDEAAVIRCIRDGLGSSLGWIAQARMELEAVAPRAASALVAMGQRAEFIPDEISRLRLFEAGLACPSAGSRRPLVAEMVLSIVREEGGVTAATEAVPEPAARAVVLVSEDTDRGGRIRAVSATEGDLVVVELPERQWRAWQVLAAASAPVPAKELAATLGNMDTGGATSLVQRIRDRLGSVGLAHALENVWGSGYVVRTEVELRG